MATDNVSATSITLPKRPISRKHPIHRDSRSSERSRTEEFRLKRTMTAINRPSSKQLNVPAKASFYSSILEPMLLKGDHSQQKDSLPTSPPKIERSSTTINVETRLPILYSLKSDQDQKRMSENRRRQIYALNHLMRDLEQEQFRQFCKIHELNINKSENTSNVNGDTIKDVLT